MTRVTTFFRQLLIINCSLLIITACSVQKQIAKSANEDVLSNKALQAAHVGISIFDPATNKYLYNYQGDKYFVPASNTKLPTCYAAMKYLGDSLVGLRYGVPEEKMYHSRLIAIQPTGDPSFLHTNFKNQPVFAFLKQELLAGDKEVAFMDTVWKDERWGSGWSWNDYDAGYMAERSPFPVFGNVINITLSKEKDTTPMGKIVFKTTSPFFDSIINKDWEGEDFDKEKFIISRDIAVNEFRFAESSVTFKNQEIPFVTFKNRTTFDVLNDLFHRKFFDYVRVWPTDEKNKYAYDCPGCDVTFFHVNRWNIIYSQPTDSLLKPMMHRSDNFFAEQSLLMVSNERLGVMNDEKIIDTLLKTDFKDLPQKPRWVDGSGLSRYNLFTPQDFVTILNKMKNEFGMERIKVILPTGGEGTISSYYKADSGYIYGKTGTLSGVVAFSGFLYTKKGKLLIFSTLVNNHQATATEVRKAMEKFLEGVRNKY